MRDKLTALIVELRKRADGQKIAACDWHPETETYESMVISIITKEIESILDEPDPQPQLSLEKNKAEDNFRAVLIEVLDRNHVSTGDQMRIDKALRSVWKLEAQPAEPTPSESACCPKCGGALMSAGGHGSWCPKETCKWGWEIEMDGSPLKPPAPTPSEPQDFRSAMDAKEDYIAALTKSNNELM